MSDVFVSYKRENEGRVEPLVLALQEHGLSAWWDRGLPGGEQWRANIESALEQAKCVVVAWTKASIGAEGSFVKEEAARGARRKILVPVMLEKVEPPLGFGELQAIDLTHWRGSAQDPFVLDLVSAVRAKIEGREVPPPLGPMKRRRRRLTVGGVAAVIAVAVALGVAGNIEHKRRTQEAQATELATAARQLCESGDHALAWQRYDEVIARHPNRQPLREQRESCGMRWLREIHVREGKQTFTEIVDRVLPVLVEGLASASPARAADLEAHMGWADFLRFREGAVRLRPAVHYRKALTHDAANVYAHAMWGHHIVVMKGPLDEARQHFDAALTSGRERAFVRSMQFAAMLYHHELAGQVESARIANEMRKGGEAIDSELRERLWTYVYYDGLTSRDRRSGFVSAMRNLESAATFQWLYPENEVRADRRKLWRFLLASLEEAAGERAAARSRFESLRDELQRERSSGPILDETIAAIKRLASP